MTNKKFKSLEINDVEYYLNVILFSLDLFRIYF